MELKPCPHCGGEVEIEDDPGLGFIVYCKQCDTIFVTNKWEDGEEETIKAWNRRYGK